MSASNRSIPPELEQPVISQHLAGKSSRAIAAWLLAEHKLEVSYRSVARFLEGTREEHAAGIKSAVRSKLEGQVLGDLERLEIHVEHLHEIALEQLKSKKIRGYLSTVEQLRKLSHTRLHFSGADAPDDSLTELAAARERVNGRLARLAAARRAGGVVGGERPDPAGGGSD